MDSQRGGNFLRIAIMDFCTFVTLGLFNLIVAQVIRPYKRGFFCDDQSIKYPNKSSTIPSVMLNVVGILVPCLAIIITELQRGRRKKHSGVAFVVGRYRVLEYQWNIFNGILGFGTGAVFSQLVTDVAKVTIGRLRPNFIDVCRPNITAEMCANNPELRYSYITQYKCQNDDYLVDASRVSFPSGHTSFSFYCAVFLVIYLENRMTMPKNCYTKPIIQYLYILLAWFVALTRIVNNKHHWSDVCAGLVIGVSAGLINTIYVMKLLENPNRSVLAEPAASTNSSATIGTRNNTEMV